MLRGWCVTPRDSAQPAREVGARRWSDERQSYRLWDQGSATCAGAVGACASIEKTRKDVCRPYNRKLFPPPASTQVRLVTEPEGACEAKTENALKNERKTIMAKCPTNYLKAAWSTDYFSGASELDVGLTPVGCGYPSICSESTEGAASRAADERLTQRIDEEKKQAIELECKSHGRRPRGRLESPRSVLNPMPIS
ncbi:MAG: hypothetical protein RLZZ450_6573 [Pseudomonadota bacterium]|jgi:hypothetical protein